MFGQPSWLRRDKQCMVPPAYDVAALKVGGWVGVQSRLPPHCVASLLVVRLLPCSGIRFLPCKLGLVDKHCPTLGRCLLLSYILPATLQVAYECACGQPFWAARSSGISSALRVAAVRRASLGMRAESRWRALPCWRRRGAALSCCRTSWHNFGWVFPVATALTAGQLSGSCHAWPLPSTASCHHNNHQQRPTFPLHCLAARPPARLPALQPEPMDVDAAVRLLLTTMLRQKEVQQERKGEDDLADMR